jgi:hypothetical protein
VGGGVGEKGRRVNALQKCVHLYVNAKMIPVETTPVIRVGGRIKENSRGGEFMYDIFDTL